MLSSRGIAHVNDQFMPVTYQPLILARPFSSFIFLSFFINFAAASASSSINISHSSPADAVAGAVPTADSSADAVSPSAPPPAPPLPSATRERPAFFSTVPKYLNPCELFNHLVTCTPQQWTHVTLTATVARYMRAVTSIELRGFFRERADGRELMRRGFGINSEINAFSKRIPNFRPHTNRGMN